MPETVVPNDMISSYLSDQTAAKRIGQRIRKIRELKGLSQSDLGALVGLTADRIQKYENGARRPKIELLSQIAAALSVNVLALADICTDTNISTMFALFDIEDKYGIEFVNSEFGTALRIRNDDIGEYIRQWKEQHKSFQNLSEISYTENERSSFRAEYDLWRWSFPGIRTADESKRILEKQKTVLEGRLREIEQELVRLEQT